MEIRIWLCYILIKCVLIQYLSAKSVSLNEIIAAESQQNQVSEKRLLPNSKDLNTKSVSPNEITAAQSQQNQVSEKLLLPRLKGLTANTVKRITTPQLRENHSLKLPRIKIPGLHSHPSLFKRLLHTKPRGLKQDIRSILRDTKISPLRYKKLFKIKSPLKPKKLKLSLKSKRKSQSIKREIIGNESLKHKYTIPLLKSLSMLFDNLLNSSESESFEFKTKKYKRYQFYSEEHDDVPCNCSNTPKFKPISTQSPKKATTPASSFSTEISSNTEGITINTNYDYSDYRPHKNIPVLLARNTFSRRRVNNRSSKRSSSTPYRNIKGNISRDYGDNEYDTRCGENDSCTKSHENDTVGDTRNDASSARHRRTDGKRNNTRNSKNRKRTPEVTKTENSKDTVRKNQFKIGRNKTESENVIREPVRRLRGLISNKNITHEGLIRERAKSEEIGKESVLSATYNSTSDKRISNQNGTSPSEDEKIRPRNETVILIESNLRHNGNYSKANTTNKAPVVLIFDGYSVTRDKNGENKVSGKTIHIRS